MGNEKEITNEEEVSFSDIVVMFIKRKWWFIGTFLIVLVLGMAYIFLQPVNHILTYQIEMKEKYDNESLNMLYPNYANDLNHLSVQNIPAIFKSEKVLSSIKDIDDDIDYQKLRESDSVKIELNKGTSIFNIIVSWSDNELADNIIMTLIATFENIIEDNEKLILEKVLDKIGADIEDLEEENTILQDTNINELEDEIDALYTKLSRYIVDYNIDLSNRLEENKNSENVSFYNVIIPPNDISNKIDTLKKEMNLYETRVIENKQKIIDLNNLTEELQKDEVIINERIRLLSGSPTYTTESDRLRNILIIAVLSIVLGIIVTFIINFIHNSRIKERVEKK